MTSSTMVSILRVTNSLERAGKLGSDTNPQILAAVVKSRETGRHFSAVRAAKIFDDIVTRDSQPPQRARVPDGRERIIEL